MLLCNSVKIYSTLKSHASTLVVDPYTTDGVYTNLCLRSIPYLYDNSLQMLAS